jgi:hypothetical protein
MPFFKADDILLLRALERGAEIGIEPRAVVLEEHELFVEGRGIELQVLGPFEAFEAADGLVDTSIH